MNTQTLSSLPKEGLEKVINSALAALDAIDVTIATEPLNPHVNDLVFAQGLLQGVLRRATEPYRERYGDAALDGVYEAYDERFN